MIGLGTILGWKFDHAEGIKTVDDVLVDWPAVLGARPTDHDLTRWRIEYDETLAAQATNAATLDVLLAGLEAGDLDHEQTQTLLRLERFLNR